MLHSKPGWSVGGTRSRPYIRKAPIPSPSPKSPKSRQQNKTKRPVILARWSGVNLTTEYPIYQPDLDHDSSVWETIEEFPTSTSAQPSGAVTKAASPVRPVRQPLTFLTPQRQNVWRFSGPSDGMGALPIPATRENALLIHTCLSFHSTLRRQLLTPYSCQVAPPLQGLI